MRIGVAGDVFIASPQRVTADPQVKAWRENLDGMWINLEGPLRSTAQPIRKTGPNMDQDPSVLDLLDDLRASVTLANNHIFDFGLPGLRETTRALDKRGIQWTGASLDGARGVSRLGDVAVINRGEAEWVTDEHGRGAWVFDLIETVRTIAEVRQTGGIPVLLLHGGNERYPLPSPRRRETARFLAEMGAAAIIYHHTHVPSAMETWHGVPICYGLGNLVFDYPSAPPDFHRGLIADLTVADGKTTVQLRVTQYDPTRRRLRFAPETDLLEEIDALKRVVADDAALQARWEAFVAANSDSLLRIGVPLASSRRRYVAGGIHKGLTRRLTSRPNDLDPLLNALRCDSHRDALTTWLQMRRDP